MKKLLIIALLFAECSSKNSNSDNFDSEDNWESEIKKRWDSIDKVIKHQHDSAQDAFEKKLQYIIDTTFDKSIIIKSKGDMPKNTTQTYTPEFSDIVFDYSILNASSRQDFTEYRIYGNYMDAGEVLDDFKVKKTYS